jgi:hypothetical protein
MSLNGMHGLLYSAMWMQLRVCRSDVPVVTASLIASSVASTESGLWCITAAAAAAAAAVDPAAAAA